MDTVPFRSNALAVRRPQPGGRRGSSIRLGLLLVMTISAAGCSGYKIELDRVAPEEAYRERNEDALSGNELSNATKIALRRNDLAETQRVAPQEVIAALHQKVVDGRAEVDDVGALAEVSFAYARSLEKALPEVDRREETAARGAVFESSAGREARAHYLAAALYAFAYVFPPTSGDKPAVINPRARDATEIYNEALARAFSDDLGVVYPRSGTFGLPFGTLEVGFDANDLRWGDRELATMLPVIDYNVHGVVNRYRQEGAGAALVAKTVPRAETSAPDFVDPNAWVAATLIMLFKDPWQQLRETNLEARLRLFKEHDGDPSLVLDNRHLPIEYEPSAALVASFEQSKVWESGMSRFFGRAMAIDQASRLYARKPYSGGQIPIVLVHGTDSTPATWIDTVNDLEADPEIRNRYTFWFFSYESGNPILYSAWILRSSMDAARARLDPEHLDPCLDQMVVIGHSQGGLLTKLTAVDSGTEFWDKQFDAPFEELEDEIDPEVRELVREGMFVKPLPYVDRVVFISTPHRGSYLASPDLVRRLAARLIRMPRDVVTIGASAGRLNRHRYKRFQRSTVSTSIDNMSPSDPFIEVLSEIPIAPPAKAHSIVALRPGEDRETGGDGVVKYKSAHIEGVESELIVASSHSAQAKPATIEELRRILRLHTAENGCWGPNP